MDILVTVCTPPSCLHSSVSLPLANHFGSYLANASLHHPAHNNLAACLGMSFPRQPRATITTSSSYASNTATSCFGIHCFCELRRPARPRPHTIPRPHAPGALHGDWDWALTASAAVGARAKMSFLNRHESWAWLHVTPTTKSFYKPMGPAHPCFLWNHALALCPKNPSKAPPLRRWGRWQPDMHP